ncbi:GNAT family N-acetyltransferase [Oceanirhabdus seepicola]|uniref:GNAT family N-acetyltransferase n=1 Tax=Oceanirhabdus seepicola TaxID=2828781 RepID=A0A9J6NYN8_9CLOT|nr:GNAT family N-acetyltransferase [Oceanirhabdus seepicola]MCM1989379.1 GNAT family N-acetyltransferase [Oceanirhabdus seepicola]
MVKIETDRLLLRTLTRDDLDSVMDFWGNEEVMKYCGGAGTRERELRAIDFYINLQNEKGFSPYIVILKENCEIIGACGFNPTKKDHEIELIYHFAQKYWGRGYATEAGKACINYASNNLKPNKIIASIHPNNISSRKVLEKLGFEYKGMKWFEATQEKEPYFEFPISKFQIIPIK